VEVHIENHFADATLTIWIDSTLTYEHPLRNGRRKRLILLGGGAKETVTLALPSGKHTLRVRVRSAKEQYDQTKSIDGEFPQGAERILSISFEKHTREMRVTLGGK
jgi:hypothetical protein